MKKYYENKIKNCEEKIAFFEKLLSEEKQQLDNYKNWLKECEIDEKIETYKKQLMEENK